MTRGKKLNGTEEQITSKELDGVCEQADSDHKQDQSSTTNTDGRHYDNTANYATGGARKRKRLRQLSAPQEGSAGKSLGYTCHNHLREGQRCLSLPCGFSSYSRHPSGGADGDLFKCVCKRGSGVDRDATFRASKSAENNSSSFNTNTENGSAVCRQCGREVKTSRFGYQLDVGEEKHSKSIQRTKLSNLIKKNILKLLMGLFGALMLPLTYNWLDCNDSISLSKYQLDHSFCYIQLDKGPLDIQFVRTADTIHYDFKSSKNIPVYNERKLPVWLNESIPAFTITAMHLTSSSTLIPTPRPTPVVNWASFLTASQSVTRTPTPPLPRVPSILNFHPFFEGTVYPQSVSYSQNQCPGVAESKGVSASRSDTFARDCMAKPATSYNHGAFEPNCVHDGHLVVYHCCHCGLWTCVRCSRANFITTMGCDNLIFHQINTAECCSGSESFSPVRNLVSLHPNWWQRNMRHEYISTSSRPSASVRHRESTYNSATEAAEILKSYTTLTSAVSSVSAVLSRISPPVTDTRYSITIDRALNYLNRHFVSVNTFESTVLEQYLVHQDVLKALRGCGTAIRDLHALRTICHDYKTQLVDVRPYLPLLKLSGRIMDDNEMTASGKHPGENCEEEEFYFLESEEDLSDDNVNEKVEGKGCLFQSKTSRGFKGKKRSFKGEKSYFEGKTAHTKYSDTSQFLTGISQSIGVESQVHLSARTYRQNGPSQNSPNCIETSSAHAGGARPKTNTRRKKSRKPKKRV